MESGSGTIIREWHPQSKVPGRFGQHKTLTRFQRWRGPLVPTAPLNSSIGAGWITPASLRTKHRIGAGLRRLTHKTATQRPEIRATYQLLGQEVARRPNFSRVQRIKI